MEKKNKNSFEKNISRLQEISELLEAEELSLEDAIHLYEEGVALSKICADELNKAEMKIKQIKVNAGIFSQPEEKNGDSE